MIETIHDGGGRARRFAVVRDGVCENVVIATPEFEIPGAVMVPDDGAASIGATWDGRRFVRPEPPAPDPEPPRGPTLEARIAAIEAALTARVAP